MTRRLLTSLVLMGATLAVVPSVADAQSAIWGQMRFLDGKKTQVIPYAEGSRVTGTLWICDNASQRIVSIGEYVKTGPGSYSLWRGETRGLPYPGACPGTVTVSWDIPPGPSRTINLGYFGDGPEGAGYVGNYESILELTVTYRLTLSAADRRVRNGDTVFFSGVMPAYFFSGPPTILLQVRVGKKWRTFKALQTLADGSYFGTYRFTNTRSRQTYKFRAKPFGASLYTFAVSPSKKVKVKVKP